MSILSHPVVGGRNGLISIALLAIILLLVIPLTLDAFRINNMGKYLGLAFVAVGLVMCWGYCGILSLGQGLFWGLGAYCMAAFLKLEAAASIAKESSDQNKALTTVGLPDFMDWNQITVLPWFWEPFHSFPLTIVLIFALPTILAYIIGIAIFKRRISGVYFAIITQALCWATEILFVTRQGWTGGINGITDLRTLLGWSIQTPEHQTIIYMITAALLISCVLLGRWLLASKFGRLLVAVRDMEDRVRFSGYDVANIKTMVFCIASAISGLGGALYVLNVGFISPKLITIEPSILMVLFCAVGGRMSLLGAVYGTIAVMFGKTFLSEEFPALWYFFIGGSFILITLFFPDGLAGIVQRWVWPRFDALWGGSSKPPQPPSNESPISSPPVNPASP